MLLGGLGGTSAESGQESAIENCDTGADANEDDQCRMAAAADSLDRFWAGQVEGYRVDRQTERDRRLLDKSRYFDD